MYFNIVFNILFLKTLKIYKYIIFVHMCRTINATRLVCSKNDKIVVDSIKDLYRLYLPTIFLMKKLYQYNLVSLLKTDQMKREKPTVLQQKDKNYNYWNLYYVKYHYEVFFLNQN